MRSAAAVLAAAATLALALLLDVADVALARHQHRSGNSGHKPSGDISLWIDQQQIKMFSGTVHRSSLLSLKILSEVGFLIFFPL